jgi:hypothetical protein
MAVGETRVVHVAPTAVRPGVLWRSSILAVTGRYRLRRNRHAKFLGEKRSLETIDLRATLDLSEAKTV